MENVELINSWCEAMDYEIETEENEELLKELEF